MRPVAGLINAAIRYAKAGVFVFPLRVRIVHGRKSVTPISHWDQESTVDRRTIIGWFNPRCGVWRDGSLGIDCGKSGLVVVDPDGAEGVASWGAFALQHRIAATWRCATPGGGQHWYFRADPATEFGNTAGKIAPHVDTRGRGGFVIAPPSRDTRGAYRWLEGEPEWQQLPVIPQIVVERATRRDRPPPVGIAPRANGSVRRFTHDQAIEFCRPWMDALSAAQEGTRNHALNTAAKVLSHFVPTFWTRDQVETWLDRALDPTYPRDESYRTIDSVFRSAATDWVAQPWLPTTHPKAG